MKKWEEKTTKQNKARKVDVYHMCDQLAMAVAINHDIIEESLHLYGNVELVGKETRGQMVWDWQGRTAQKPNIHLVTKLYGNCLKQMLFHAYQK